MHMGLLTALADLISVIINPENAKTFVFNGEESKKGSPTVTNSQGLSIQPIRMDVPRERDYKINEEHKLSAVSSRKKPEPQYSVATPVEEEELYKQTVFLLLTPEQQKSELFVKTLSD